MTRKTNIFLIAWDCTGLESVIPVSEIEKINEQKRMEREWAILADPDMRDPGDLGAQNINKLMNMMMLRARFNTQRSYEIYSVHADASVSREDLVEMFNQSPQTAADLIRERGNKIYSDRAIKERVIT
jgi:hypothetical protein